MTTIEIIQKTKAAWRILNHASTEKKKAGKTKKQKAEESTLTKETEIKNSIRTIIDENSDADGWVLASTVGTLMQNKYPDFDCRNYGCKKMIDLLQSHFIYRECVSL